MDDAKPVLMPPVQLGIVSVDVLLVKMATTINLVLVLNAQIPVVKIVIFPVKLVFPVMLANSM